VNDSPNFYTATCLEWRHILADDGYKDIIINSLRFLVENKRIWLYGFVIMPNHIHLLWRKRDAWADKNVQLHFMKFTAQQIKFRMIDTGSSMLEEFQSTQSDRKYQIWERNPFMAAMNSREVLEQKLEYIHNNPVRKQYVERAEDYKFSSARYYMCNIDDWGFITHYKDHI
jgi:putative transposase